MKRAIFIFFILGLAVTLNAQASLFGLEFGAKTEDLKAMLKSQGFKESTNNGSLVIFSPATDSLMPTINLTLSTEGDKLIEWTISYPAGPNPDSVIAKILAELEEIHGEPDVIADYGTDYIWYFQGGHALYLNNLGIKFFLEYTYGNWDDDDYFWYEFFW